MRPWAGQLPCPRDRAARLAHAPTVPVRRRRRLQAPVREQASRSSGTLRPWGRFRHFPGNPPRSCSGVAPVLHGLVVAVEHLMQELSREAGVVESGGQQLLRQRPPPRVKGVQLGFVFSDVTHNGREFWMSSQVSKPLRFEGDQSRSLFQKPSRCVSNIDLGFNRLKAP